MKWVTRARPKTDRIACPWLITKFIDPAAEILYVPADQVLDVARREDAVGLADGTALGDPGQVAFPHLGRDADGAQAGDHGLSSGRLAAGTSGAGGEPGSPGTGTWRNHRHRARS